jgi:NAD+ kinase
MRLGILASTAYDGLDEVLARVRNEADALGLDLAFDARTASGLDDPPPLLEESWEALDCLLTLGGDGTLLRGARQAGPRGIPVLGCNIGRLGFLTSAPLSELERALERLAAGEYREEERATLSVAVERAAGRPADGGPPSREPTDQGSEFYALNDAVVHKSGFARLITLRVWVDDEEVGQYSADGIVLATATGSTAYSLSAGGPVLVPDMDAVVATPISPHTLAVRPVVVPADSDITVEVRPRSEDTILTLDGQSGVELAVGDRVEARRSPDPVRLVQFPGQSFFSVLRRKLRWGDVRPSDR